MSLHTRGEGDDNGLHRHGRRIRHYREYYKLTLEGLSPLAGISASFLGHIERGSRKPSVETLLFIARALRVPTDILLTDSLRFKPNLDKTLLRDMVGSIQSLIDEDPNAE